MKTVWMFPGTDALEDPVRRAHAWSLPEVRKRVLEAEHVLRDSSGVDLDLQNFMTTPNAASKRWLHQLAVATVPVQVALFEHQLQVSASPSLLVGCSLGDVARNVCSGALSFETGVRAVYDFVRHTTELRGGAVVHVKSEQEFVPDFYRSVQDYQLELSVSQTPRHCLIAGPSTELERWAKSESSRFSARVRPMYPFPIHTSWMNPVLDKIFHNIIEACADPKWKIPMFSTIHCRPIVSRADLLRDTMDNIVSAVRWAESVQSLAKAGYDRFINIGPAATLVSFIQNSPIANEVQTEDSFAPFLPAKQQIGGMNATVFA